MDVTKNNSHATKNSSALTRPTVPGIAAAAVVAAADDAC